ncbi:hypothetical protein [Pseudomonas koreensis]|uniref:hypothetical protein n=1 Tax=Pseudomonas koreensis TaxID=198620 RepID=UPI003F866BE1
MLQMRRQTPLQAPGRHRWQITAQEINNPLTIQQMSVSSAAALDLQGPPRPKSQTQKKAPTIRSGLLCYPSVNISTA